MVIQGQTSTRRRQEPTLGRDALSWEKPPNAYTGSQEHAGIYLSDDTVALFQEYTRKRDGQPGRRAVHIVDVRPQASTQSRVLCRAIEFIDNSTARMMIEFALLMIR